MKKSRIEEIRNRYDPKWVGKDIAILFVGESAPSENRFFYLRNTILYCAFFMAFRIVYGVKEDEFLEYFQKLGCFLYDLLPCGKKWKVASGEEKDQAKAKFRDFIEERRPKMVVTIMKSLSKDVESEIKKTNINIVFRNDLRFPKDPRLLCEYVEGLEEILREAIDLKILPGSILSKKQE